MSLRLSGLGVLVAAALAGCASRRSVSGAVVDRNGAPVPRAIVALAPGTAEVLTDDAGRYTFLYARDAAGERVPLRPRSAYTVAVVRPGFHLAEVEARYARGRVELPPITLIPETLRVDAGALGRGALGPAGAAGSAGATHEGE